ncbi:Stk1 family PASTA domain-containing Ser/Thr kinase [Arthrobacter sp. Soil782]|uniref:Stk1 family PASTA domain-containing Ser/Thr kinase n=1 Tax=Arthrobacter sp. Soil782 TaxID=1736410 RepID=UPI0012FB92E9|nr:Stk1 family PASTA domain-containing Ser/Thr kinase [Arthrobacter sp. Soil782]
MSSERVLNGRYEMGELIGRGGMADVHLGRDVRLGRTVAIKVLRRDLARDPLFQSRFRREAQAVAGLNHPTIVSVYDTGEEEVEGQHHDEVRVPFIVMEYVAGRTLRDLLKRGELTPETSVDYLLGVLSALEYSHRAGIVHRDIKPANVMITPEGQVKVMDFGIARAMADSAATMTQTQAVIGTAQYLSPEQARGETVDARSDLYSAGCLLYELLTGRPPFVGDSPVSVAYQHVREIPTPAREIDASIPAEIESVLSIALEKDRARRFQSAADFRSALRDARKGIRPDVPAAPTEAIAAVPTRTDDDAPQTRAMARVLAGGSIAADSLVEEEETGSLPVAHAAQNRRDAEDRTRSRRRGWIAVLLVLLALLLSAGGIALFGILNAQPEEPILTSVPAVDSLSETEASNALTAVGLRPQVERTFHDEVESGFAITTDPEAGSEVEPDALVSLLISKGPANRAIPEDIFQMTESSARDALESVGLRGGSVSEANSATVPAGRVIETEPALGSTVPADSEVNLVLSTGLVTVPRLTSLPSDEAVALLEDPARALVPRIEEEPNAVVEPGLVVRQEPVANSNIAPGTEVVIYVATKPAEEEPAPSTAPPPASSAPAEEEEPGNQGRGRGQGNGQGNSGVVGDAVEGLGP